MDEGTGFRVCVRTGEKATAGPSTTLRSGRDDNFVVRFTHILEERTYFLANELSSRPERTRISCHAALTNVRVCGFR